MIVAEAEQVLYQGHRAKFRWSRLKQTVLTEHTCNTEMMLGLAFLALRGLALLGFGYVYPGVEYYLKSVHLSETRLGWICIFLGVSHALVGGGTELWRVRAWICCAGIVLSVIIVSAFVVGAPLGYKPIGVVWVSIGVSEIYLAFRNFRVRDAAKARLKHDGR